MKLKPVLLKIINIAEDYYNVSKSKYTLALESGYFDVYDQISERDLSIVLEEQPTKINYWIRLSEDQRSSEGKYLKINDGKFFVVEFNNTNGYHEEEQEYPNLQTACAAFVKYEIEFSRALWVEKFSKKKKK
jgi:hypothetical protein